HVRTGRGRDGGDPGRLADAGLVRGRGVPPLDRIQRATRTQAPLHRAGPAPGHRAQALPAAARQPEHAVPRRERNRRGALVTSTTTKRPRVAAAAKHANGKVANGNGKPAGPGLRPSPPPAVPRGETAAELPDWRKFVG